MASNPNLRFLHRDIQDILGILGSTRTTYLTFAAGPGDATAIVPGISTVPDVIYQTRDEAATRNINAEFGPIPLPSGLFAYHFNGAGQNNHIAASADGADHSHGNGTVDTAFSLGMWIMPEVLSDRALIAKYDATAAEEFKWQLAATTGALTLELYDASANASEIATADGTQGLPADTGAPTLFEWQMVTTTYDGTQTAPTINHYINGRNVSNANSDSVESGAYVAMENTATPLLIGASELTTAPAEEYQGYMAMPFICGKELSAAEVSKLYHITQRMVMGA